MNELSLDFLEIHTEFRPKILRYLTRMVGEYEAEDLTQEVFVKISRALTTFRGESKLSTWVYRIATNAAMDRLRDPSFKHQLQAESLSLPPNPEVSNVREEEVDRNVWTGEAAVSPEQELFLRERSDCYQDYIENLPLNYRTVVALSELEELAVSEIAVILGLSPDVVKIRLHRGRAKLLKELRAHCKPEDWL